DACNRSRETDENQAGHDGEQKYTDHDFDGGNDVTVNSLRVHVAVANSGQGLDAEEEAVEERMRRQPSNTVSTKAIKDGEEKVEPDINSSDKRGELRPPQA